MSERREYEGKIFSHGSGLGNVTPEMIEERAKEIAVIDGRKRVTKEDRIDARRELLGSDDALENWEELDQSRDAGSLDPSDVRSSSGEQYDKNEADDEALIPEHLVEEGVEEADHEQLLEGHLRREDDEEDEEK